MAGRLAYSRRTYGAQQVRPVVILGEGAIRGVYVLRIVTNRALQISFGRYGGGAPLLVPAGELLYVGSAMACSGSMTLARRLLRHATRAEPHPPQAIRPALLAALYAAGLAGEDIRPPANKKLFWNIDFLLNELAVELLQVFAVRSSLPLEAELASLMAAETACDPLAPGLGAHDHPGSTHIFIVQEDQRWWQALPDRLAGLAAAAHSKS